MASADRKNKSRDNKPFDKKSKDNKSFDKKDKQVKFNDNKSDEKSPFAAQNDKLKEAILALGGTKGDIKYLEEVDTEENDNLVTGDDEKTEVKKKLFKKFLSTY